MFEVFLFTLFLFRPAYPFLFSWIACYEFDRFQSFYGFKGFIARSLLIFFISAITGANPLYIEERNQIANSNVYYDDDTVANVTAIPDIPMSVVNFQRVTSVIL